MPPKLKKSFGDCGIAAISPPRNRLSPNTLVLNVVVPFEDALKLHRSIEECLSKLNSYNRSTTAGRRAALNLAVFLDMNRITITEAALPR